LRQNIGWDIGVLAWRISRRDWKNNKREFDGGKMGAVMILEDHM
jgi:hypothetical protein